MLAQRERIHEGTAISKALDHSLKRWTALVRCLDNGRGGIGGFLKKLMLYLTAGLKSDKQPVKRARTG